ncbi:lysosomal-associated membrane protein 1 S homeolog precursor [Xenopus laevis]|uniref:Lysosome-associated membrane glycoprotein 1 n=1 Tax=Xenopus laevis TaxID=8355 RepID=Q6AXA0_XENLA|nr:lysosomal-associated membrane protein 1 S homeolog precursor [Xenopus laevis]AAH79693.1 MGC80798 protein [Xenopus laevis]
MTVLLLVGIVQVATGVQFEVKDGKTNLTCILADLSINFTVPYSNASKQELAKFALPSDAVTNISKSSCGEEDATAPVLLIEFGSSHSLSIRFGRTNTRYQVADLVMSYNLSDKNFFPGSSENGTKTVSTNNTAVSAENGTMYKCINPHVIRMENVTATFHDIKLEAYLKQSNFSQKVSTCSEDVTPTSAPVPTTAPAPVPTTTPAPVPLPEPPAVQYTVNGSHGPCLMVKTGLQMNITYVTKDGKNASYVFNIDSKGVTVEGTCSNTTASLSLSSGSTLLTFNFTQNSSLDVFYLESVAISTDVNGTVFAEHNNTLNYMQTNAHKSFRCNSKQTLQITDRFTVNTYHLQVQAFNLDGNKFLPAVECSLDENGMLVPIVVGAALAGLILIVLIAYLIGRKRSHAGYQTI